ncbi:MFS general substrate transporter [Pleurotus eryngii]|uniref:MFS general substrate transporter n=1 Tax=Pleurotus eryngii TaxID=5323 RepID=A0A9P6A1Y2_PLEER|nr:MFS general substrate transporter [Pleurotus eryngii]
MSLSEKGSDSVVEGYEKREHVDPEVNADPAFVKAIIRRVDFYLLPMLAILYSVSLTNRTNISNAYIAGMAGELQLQIGSRYSLATLTFFVPFILLELPSNIVMRNVGAASWIGSITTLWRIVTIGLGFTKTRWELVVCRALPGALESGFLPACTNISTWYFLHRLGRDLCSPALAGGIAEMAGVGGLRGWQGIFILMGLVTVIAGLCAFAFVQDFPDKNKFLTAEQTEFVLSRIDKDRSDAEYDHWTLPKFWSYVMDIQLWGLRTCSRAHLQLHMYDISLFRGWRRKSHEIIKAFAFFLPIILVQGLGYLTLEAQLSDKYALHAPLLIFQSIITIIELTLTVFPTHNAARYSGSFLGVAGSACNILAILGYMQNNVTGYTKRSFAPALAIGGAGVGGIVPSTVFRSKDAPGYRPGRKFLLWVAIGAQFVTCALAVFYYYKNKAVREGRAPPIEGRPGFY